MYIYVALFLQDPTSWYLYMIQTTVAWSGVTAADMILSCSVWINVDTILNLKHFLIQLIVSACALSGSWAMCYVLWVHLLQFKYPMPFIGRLSHN